MNAENKKFIARLAKKREISQNDAIDYALHIAAGRLDALTRDNARRAAGKPAKVRKVTVKVLAKPKGKAKKASKK